MPSMIESFRSFYSGVWSVAVAVACFWTLNLIPSHLLCQVAFCVLKTLLQALFFCLFCGSVWEVETNPKVGVIWNNTLKIKLF